MVQIQDQVYEATGHVQFSGDPVGLLGIITGDGILQLDDPSAQEAQHVLYHLRAGRRGRQSVRHDLGEEKPPHERQQTGEGQLGERASFERLLVRDVLPLELIPVQILGLFSKEGADLRRKRAAGTGHRRLQIATERGPEMLPAGGEKRVGAFVHGERLVVASRTDGANIGLIRPRGNPTRDWPVAGRA